MVLNEEDTNEIQYSLDEGLSWVSCTFGVFLIMSVSLTIRMLSVYKILFLILTLVLNIS